MAGHLGVWTPGDPATPRALDNEELFVVKGSQKITWRNVPTAEHICKVRGAHRNIVQVSKEQLLGGPSIDCAYFSMP